MMGFVAGKSDVSDHDTVPDAVKLCVADQRASDVRGALVERVRAAKRKFPLDTSSRVPLKTGYGLACNATREPNGFAVSPHPQP
jgi:hypothetical protein